jgi:hypothetical protein
VSDFEVRGAEDFLKLSKALKAAGRGDLRKALNKGIRDATKPLVKRTRAATDRLPSSGGLAARVRAAPQRVQTRTGSDPGVRITAGKPGTGAYGADTGTVRHPVFGGSAFVSQAVPPGWFSETLAGSADEVLPEIEKAMQTVVERIVKEAR